MLDRTSTPTSLHTSYKAQREVEAAHTSSHTPCQAKPRRSPPAVAAAQASGAVAALIDQGVEPGSAARRLVETGLEVADRQLPEDPTSRSCHDVGG